MANPISAQISLGTVGELLVQLRLLQFDVQAAPPLKDSGNDLIAIRGSAMRTVQVKTTKAPRPRFPSKKRRYDLLALVQFHGHDRTLLLDQSVVYLIPKESLVHVSRSWQALVHFKLTKEHVNSLFSESHR